MKESYKILLRGALALILVNVCNSICSMVDSMIAGKFLGDKALAACGMCDPIFSFWGIISGLCTFGIGITIFKFIGSGQADKGNQFFTSVFIFSSLFSILVFIVLVVLCDPIVSLIGGGTEDVELWNNIKEYYISTIGGLVFTVMYSIIIPIAQINCKNKLISASVFLALITNILMDIVTVVIFDLGLIGIGLSTTLSNLVIVIVLMWAAIDKNNTVYLKFNGLKISYLTEVIFNGLPYAFRRIANVITKLTYNYFIISFGSAALMAGFASMWATRHLLNSFGIGMGNSIALIAGYYVGLRNQKSTLFYFKESKRLTIISSCLICVLIILISPALSLLYTEFGTETYFYSIISFCCLGISFPFVSLVEVYLGYLLTIEKKLAANIFMIIERAIFPILILFILANTFGKWGIFFSLIVSEVSTVILIKLYFIWINKKKYYIKLFLVKDCMYINVNSHAEVSAMLDKTESFFIKNNYPKNLCCQLRLCLEEILYYTINNGFNKNQQNYIATTILIDDHRTTINIQDNCKDFKLFKKMPMIMSSSDIEMVGIKLVIKMCDSFKYIEFMDTNNIQIKIE